MTSKSKTVVAFDLYGTLLSTESISKELAVHFGDDKAAEVSALWRRFQLEYTWRMNSMQLYKPFSDITRTSLLHALKESGVKLEDKDIANLMKAYDNLGTFDDVPSALEGIKNSETIDAYVFSNGTNDMVSSSVNQSPSLSKFSEVFKGLITVEEVKVYKPHPKVYSYLLKQVGKDPENKEHVASVWLVTGNPFDVVGARAAGMQAAWVDRQGHHGKGGWSDRLGDLASGGPTIVVEGVDEAIKGIEKWVEEKKL
ncbi:HAD-like protein [Glarea lozoyensis ATCC 20868]|uniref:HAD-like protein n=1 Tax=Glarea lozoyensis (strain ATCC 20868 / MF5171) TaxID=1116229 RepID=S3CHS8_GLAL2|nr:HAD-like protein [Glarea lozoyensis ATCC 20868]EPE26032.1 HAD-like protein [Glarea lozoyensis ATCC 20868]